MSARRIGLVAHWLLLAALVAAVLAAGAWRLGGGRWERVETASMGTVAPVNTLLWVEPVDAASLEVGDFITFHPPGSTGLTYSHRVAAIHPDGSLETQGEISARDPWRITDADVVGRVMWRWKGAGWLVVAAPILLVGGLLVGLLAWLTRRRDWRLPIAIVGGAIVLSAAIVVHRPLLQAQELGFAEVPEGARATYVSTGLAPIRLKAYRGSHVDLRDGEVGSVLITRPDPSGRYGVSLSQRIPWWWWVVLVGTCFLPATWTLARGRSEPVDSIAVRARHRSLRPPRRRPRAPARPHHAGRRRLPGTPSGRARTL